MHRSMVLSTFLLSMAVGCASEGNATAPLLAPAEAVDSRPILVPPTGYPIRDDAFVTQVGDGESTLRRSAAGATASARLGSQTPGHALVYFALIFNFPEHCVEGEDRLPEPGPCRGNGPADPRDGGIPEVQVSADVWASTVVGSDGTARFEVDLTRDTPLAKINPNGPGLVNPEGAVIDVYVMDKGPLAPEGALRGAQMNSLYGGCQGPPAFGELPCRGVAIVQHLPPGR